MTEYKNLLDHITKLHFLGIGGSGMCPMAILLKSKGYQLTGSDMNESETLDRVRAAGIPVTVGHRPENIGDTQAVIYTAAARDDNPELLAAKAKGIPTIERAVMLGYLTRQFDLPVCISGTHGKTTTTAMLTQILIEGGKDPNAIIGGRLPLIDGNSRTGLSDIIVCEACEYVDTFLHLAPAISIITNIDADHLDYFKTLGNIIKSFHQFADQTTQKIVVNGDNLNAMKSVAGIDRGRLITFGMQPHNDYYVIETNEEARACENFTLMHKGERLGRVNLSVPGVHNLYNAVAAAAAAHELGTAPDAICSALGHFTGVHRRFEILGTFDGITVADDFAHHPTELTAVLNSAMRMGYNNVWAIFQPHTYSRTHNHYDEFLKALSIPDHLILTEILAVREENIYGISTADLVKRLPGSVCFDSNEKIANYIMRRATDGDLIITIGGGDIYKCANLIVDKYKSRVTEHKPQRQRA